MNTKYTIVQDVLSQDKKGTLSASEVVLAYPDTLVNANTRLLKWQNILKIENIRMRQATMSDFPKTKKQKRKEKTCTRR
jgi:hypothetical protein